MLLESERAPEVEGRDESDEERVVVVGASLGWRWWWRGKCMSREGEDGSSAGSWCCWDCRVAEARRLRWLRKLWRMRVDGWWSCCGKQNISYYNVRLAGRASMPGLGDKAFGCVWRVRRV